MQFRPLIFFLRPGVLFVGETRLCIPSAQSVAHESFCSMLQIMYPYEYAFHHQKNLTAKRFQYVVQHAQRPRQPRERCCKRNLRKLLPAPTMR